MNDWGKSVLEQYDLPFVAVRKGRGALICETETKLYCLQAFRGAEKRLEEEAKLLQYLKEKGHMVDCMIANREGSYVSLNEYQDKFMLREWYAGEECSSVQTADLLRAVRKLAKLHTDMRNVPEFEEASVSQDSASEASLTADFERHNREMRKIMAYIKKRKKKTQFETDVMGSFSEMFEQAMEATRKLQNSRYNELFEEALKKRHLIHGNYNYHNIYLLEKDEAAVNFSHFSVQVQMKDLYDFLRKVLEKSEWDITLGMTLLEAYNAILPISPCEKEILCSLLLYPEKYWKQLNYYYNSNKAWIPLRNIEKLNKAVVQAEMREKFIKSILY